MTDQIEPITLAQLADLIGLEEAVRVAMEQLGMSETDARMEIGIGRGDIGPEGDVLDVGINE